MTSRMRGGRSTAEWVTLALSLFVVGALAVVSLVEEAQRQREEGSSIEVTFDGDQAIVRDESFYVPYTIRNTGSDAISSAEIWLEVFDDEELVESEEVIVQFLPLQGNQDGVFVTTHDPKTHHFRGRLESLQIP